MSDWTQRWRDGRHSWRHRSEGGFDARRYSVELLLAEGPVKDFIVRHHYSRSFPVAKHRAVLLDRGEVVGAAVFGVPARREVLTVAFPHLDPYTESLELSRFVLLDQVPANAESWFLARAFYAAAQLGVRGVVSFSDPVPRVRADGSVLSPGHVGTIYQASNGLHTRDRSTPRTLLLAPDGRVFSARAASKVRRQERGHEYAEQLLVEWGASPRQAGDEPAKWLTQAYREARLRRVRHPGNYRYLFRLGTRAQRSRVVIGLPLAPYPKPRSIPHPDLPPL